jgi:hypothetical protein
MESIVPIDVIERKILFIQTGGNVGQGPAQLYGVETRVLNQVARRNSDRFPDDFLFSPTQDEIARISQFVISSNAHLETL